MGVRIITLLFFLTGITLAAHGQDNCESIFPDAASNSGASGDIDFYSGSSVINSPDNILHTRDLNDSAGVNTSCNGVSCTQSGNLAVSVNYNSFPGGSRVNVSSSSTVNLAPGDYEDLNLYSNATVNLAPGVYTFDGDFNVGSGSQVQISSPGSVVIYVRDDIVVNASAQINTLGSDRKLFLYARDETDLGADAIVNGIIYSRDRVNLNNGTTVTGAITSERDIRLRSVSTITFDANTVSTLDFNGFCVNTPVSAPAPIAEWRLEESLWNGSANEVVDASGNNLHGRAVLHNGVFPETENLDPAVAGDPGTCAYGNFSGTADGYVQIDDPGGGSILDLNADFAVAVWINARSLPISGLMSIVSKDENFEFHLNSSGQVNWWWGGGSQELTTGQSVSTSTWHHIAISFTGGSQIIYLDGSVVATNNSSQAVTLNNDPVLIGTDLGYSSRNFDGFIDEVKIYSQTLSSAEVAAIMAEGHPCVVAPLIDHFDINIGSGNASTCVPAEISITAEDVGNSTLAGYAGTVSISTSLNHGSWSETSDPLDSSGTLTPGASDSGSATYQFESSGADNGTVRFDLSNNRAESMTITVTDAAAGVSSTSATITFSENAFVVDAVDSLGNDLVANRRHDFQVQMIRNDAVTGSCGVATNYAVADVKTWLSRSVADPGGAGPQVSNAGNTDTENLGNTQPASANFTLPFVNGQANFTLLASDVGAYALNFLDDGLTFSDANIAGGSATLVARPFGFALDVIGNPVATDQNGAVFLAAGNDFQVNVSAVGWDSADDTDDNGVADFHDDTHPANNADLSDNPVLSSFGNESPAEALSLGSRLVLPAGGNDPGLGNSDTLADGRILDSFVNGADSTNTVYFSEVGIVEISAQIYDGDYLGAGNVFSARAQSQSGYVGRFTPSFFQVSSGTYNEACTTGLDFSYMGQAFSVQYQVEARNAFGALTANYENAFAKLTSTSGSVLFGARDALVPTDLSARLSHISTSYSWSTGTGSLTSNVLIGRSTAPDGPYDQLDLGVIASDADGVSVRASALNLDIDNDLSNDFVGLGQTEVRHGRLRLGESFGPETADLPVSFIAEYWTGNAWQFNTDDSCTSVSLASIAYPDGTIDTVANRSVTVGGGSSTGTYTSLTGLAVNFVNGDAGQFFSAPGAGNTGTISVDVDLTLYPWLRFDWDQDGDHADFALPTASFTFGSYRGHDRIIFWREVLQ